MRAATPFSPALADAAVAPGAHDRISVKAPFTLEEIGTIPRGTTDDVEEALRRARAAHSAWASRGVRERSRILLRFHDLLLDRREELLDLIQLESGKARRYALEEIIDTALVARHYAFHAAKYLRPVTRRGGLPLLTTATEYHRPIGVVGFISPWNFPLILGITDLIPALMAGNAAILRPDVHASFTALRTAELLYEAGLPRDVLSIVTGEGSVLGPAIVDGVDYVMFTGSTRTGKTVARQAAERLTGFSLELGGKNAMIVLEDAPLDAAVDGLIRGAFTGAGQVCVSIERAFIPDSMFEAFASKVAERVQAMKMSAEFAYGVDMGSLTTPRQLATVSAHVEDAVAKGAEVIAGARARPDLGPLFYDPTVLASVTPAMTLYAEETFGPVVSLYRYNDVDAAIRQANDTVYGLNASVWSRDLDAAQHVASRLRAGMVNINEAYAASWTATSTPIGGVKQSGFGRRHGAEGILKYTEAQTVAVQRWMPLAPPPFLSEGTYARLMSGVLRMMRRVPGIR